MLALLCYPDEVKGLLSQVLQVVLGRESFSAPVTSGLVLKPVSGIDGWRGKEEQLSPTQAVTGQLGDVDSSPLFTTLGLAYLYSNIRMGSIMLPRKGIGPALPSVAACGAQGQISHSYDHRTSSTSCLRHWLFGVGGDEGNSALLVPPQNRWEVELVSMFTTS